MLVPMFMMMVVRMLVRVLVLMFMRMFRLIAMTLMQPFVVLVLLAFAPILFARHVFLAAGVNINLSGADSAAQHAPHLDARPHIERRDRVFQHARRYAGIDQRAQKHVAAYAGKTVEVGYAHRNESLAAGRSSLATTASDEPESWQIAALMGVRANDQRPATDDRSFIIGNPVTSVKPAVRFEFVRITVPSIG